jgi:hypothetical protein
MKASPGIDGPDQVEEGTREVEVTAEGSDFVWVGVSGPGRTERVRVGPDGKARIPIPPGTLSGQTVFIVDSENPSINHEIDIVPPTGR